MWFELLFGWLFYKKPEGAFSIRGFWGQTKHYNKDGVQIGYSVKTFFGRGRKRYDMDGNLVSRTYRNFWGTGYNTYDANGNLVRRTIRNFWGRGYNTFDANGNLIRRSTRNFWGRGYNTYDANGKKAHISYTDFWEDSDYHETDKYSAPKSHYSSPKAVNYNAVKMTTAQTSQSKESRKPAAEPHEQQEKKTVKPASTEKKATYTVSSTPYGEWEDDKNKNRTYSLDEIPYEAPKIDKSVEYISKTDEYIEDSEVEECVNLLVFSYGNMKEFPANAYISGEKLRIRPMIAGAEIFEIDLSEVMNVKFEQINGLDMSVVDNEFATVCASGVGAKYESLLPEYSWEYEGMSRIQCVFPCGLKITEKSMDGLRSKILK